MHDKPLRQLFAIGLASVFLSFFMPTGAAGETGTVVSQASASFRIGVVNIAALLKQAPQAKEADARLKTEFAPQQKELNEMAQKLEKLRKKYEKEKLTLSEAQKAEREREIVLLGRELQRRRASIQEVVNLRRNEELAKLQTLINSAVHAIGKRENYDLILYDGIAYSSARIDITPKVLSYLQQLVDQSKSSFNK